jgi:hypothetical protein
LSFFLLFFHTKNNSFLMFQPQTEVRKHIIQTSNLICRQIQSIKTILLYFLAFFFKSIWAFIVFWRFFFVLWIIIIYYLFLVTILPKFLARILLFWYFFFLLWIFIWIRYFFIYLFNLIILKVYLCFILYLRLNFYLLNLCLI